MVIEKIEQPDSADDVARVVAFISQKPLGGTTNYLTEESE
jgi:hypothetical protein